MQLIKNLIYKYKSTKLNKSYIDLVNFLLHDFKKVSQLEYLKDNKYILSIQDQPNPLVKGREHSLIITLMPTKYRISKDGTIFKIESDDETRNRSYNFAYLYYQCKEKDPNRIQLNFIDLNIL